MEADSKLRRLLLGKTQTMNRRSWLQSLAALFVFSRAESNPFSFKPPLYPYPLSYDQMRALMVQRGLVPNGGDITVAWDDGNLQTFRSVL